MSIRIWSVMSIFLLVLCLSGRVHAFEERLDDPAKEATARDIFKKVRCMVCEGQMIYDSNSQLAADMRGQIREMLKQNKSETQILTELGQTYGPEMVVSNGYNKIIAILLPILVLCAGGFIIYKLQAVKN